MPTVLITGRATMNAHKSLGSVTANIFNLSLEGHNIQVRRGKAGLGGGGFVCRGGRKEPRGWDGGNHATSHLKLLFNPVCMINV